MRLFIALSLVAVSCGGLSARATPTATPLPTGAPASAVATPVRGRDLSARDAQALVATKVGAAMDALKRRDGPSLAALAHPTKGIRFTPYPYVQPGRDIVLMRASLTNAYSDPTKRTWGVSDGRGDPLTFTFAEYAAQFVWNRDFLAAPKTSYNRPIGGGNTIENTADVYPNAILFEAYDPGPDPAMESVQWQSIRLLFEQDAGAWYVVGIVHGQWTI